MGDFILDSRSSEWRNLASAARALKFSRSSQVAFFETGDLALVISCSGSADLWAPLHTEDGSIFAVAGMCALTGDDWREAETGPGAGGLAARRIRQLYTQGGVPALRSISGNCVIIVADAPRRKVFLIGDPSGAFPFFSCHSGGGWLFGSHPDVLADAAGENFRRDEVSLAEFLIASTVTPPYTYYERVKEVETGVTITLDLATRRCEREQHHRLIFRGDGRTGEEELAEELATAFRDAVRRRTLPRLGRPAIALSGGLDSRLLLACLEDPGRALAFTLFDAPNRELGFAERLAGAAGVSFVPIQRSPDYYAENAEAGVRISGGMGTFANNHFLGVLDRLHAQGMEVMLTGCYCDYMFKGLPLNRRSHWLTGRESLAPFSHQFYFSRWMPDTALARAVRARWEERFPLSMQRQDSDADTFEIEVRRTFPLCYEGDNQQRVVPQRLTGWFVPVADHGVLDVYSRIPSRMKLNRSIFRRTARRLLADSPLRKIPDANTGVPLDASPMREWIASGSMRLLRKLRQRRRTLASDGSWPDWQYYLTHSPGMAELWRRPNAEADDFARRAMGWDSVPGHPRDFSAGRVFQFVPLLTQRIWFSQRACSGA